MGLMRGVYDIIAALQLAGGAQVLAAADPAAAACLCRGLMQAVSDPRHTFVLSNTRIAVERAFAVLGPGYLRDAAAIWREGVPGFPQHACAAIQLVKALLRDGHKEVCGAGTRQAALATAARQKVAAECTGLLRAVADALEEWSTTANTASKQQRKLHRESKQQPGRRPNTAPEPEGNAVWLPGAASSLLQCMREHQLCSMLDGRQLLDTLGQLLQTAVACVQPEERAAVAGLWTLQLGYTASAACVAQLHYTILTVMMGMGTEDYAARLPALRAAISRALCTAVDHLATPRRLPLLLHLTMTAHLTVREGGMENYPTMMSQLARLQQLATSWQSALAHAMLPGNLAEATPAPIEFLPVAVQVALLMDINLDHLSAMLDRMLSSKATDPATDITCICDSGAIDALAAALGAAPASSCRNVRSLAGMVFPDASSCLAPGLYYAASALAEVMIQDAKITPAFAALVRSGLGSFRLAHAEAAAQDALPPTTPAAMRPDACRPHNMRRHATNILTGATRRITQPVFYTLPQLGLVTPLLEALPWQPTSSESTTDATVWQLTDIGMTSVKHILGAIMSIDMSAHAAVKQDGSGVAAVQRIRDVQLPPTLAAKWPRELEDLLHLWQPPVQRASRKKGSRRPAAAAAAAADADAVAAAERAMQELLAEEQPSEASQRSNAASKRARKKAAKRQAAADTSNTNSEAQCTAEATNAESQRLTGNSCNSTQVKDALQPVVAATVPQATALKAPPSSDNADVLSQQPAAAGTVAADAEWWRCPLSGKVMRDPVLCGSGGHSFEREALEQWLAANPGVDPLSRQPLPPGRNNVVPNYALRNIIQQLQPS